MTMMIILIALYFVGILDQMNLINISSFNQEVFLLQYFLNPWQKISDLKNEMNV